MNKHDSYKQKDEDYTMSMSWRPHKARTDNKVYGASMGPTWDR